jgi:cysteine desulfurase/selenocysteine lyase
MRLDELTRPDFPILERVINGRRVVYLDSAASSQKPRQVIEAMVRYYERSHANVHRSIHTLGEEATELYELARDRVREFIGAQSREEIVFTRGTTDSLSLVADAVGHTLEAGDEIIITELEHHSNIIQWQMAARDRGAVVRAVPITPDGHLDMDALRRLLGPRTRVVAVAHISNVLGTINPVREIVQLARSVGALSVVDGAQAIPHVSLDMMSLECDFYAASAHKMLGPTGIGILYGRREVLERLEPTRGGSEMIKEVWIDRAQWNDLPWRFEPGTPPIAEAVGLTAAIEYLEKLGMERVAEHERELTRRAFTSLAALEGVRVFGPGPAEDRGAVVAFSVEGLHPHDVAALLDAEGIAVRAGHHCAQPLMRALGVVGTSRASFSVYNSPEEIDALVSAVEGLRSAL